MDIFNFTFQFQIQSNIENTPSHKTHHGTSDWSGTMVRRPKRLRVLAMCKYVVHVNGKKHSRCALSLTLTLILRFFVFIRSLRREKLFLRTGLRSLPKPPFGGKNASTRVSSCRSPRTTPHRRPGLARQWKSRGWVVSRSSWNTATSNTRNTHELDSRHSQPNKASRMSHKFQRCNAHHNGLKHAVRDRGPVARA